MTETTIQTLRHIAGGEINLDTVDHRSVNNLIARGYIETQPKSGRWSWWDGTSSLNMTPAGWAWIYNNY